MNYTLTLDEQEWVLIRNLVDLGIKQGGLVAARQLIALDDKIVEMSKQPTSS